MNRTNNELLPAMGTFVSASSLPGTRRARPAWLPTSARQSRQQRAMTCVRLARRTWGAEYLIQSNPSGHARAVEMLSDHCFFGPELLRPETNRGLFSVSYMGDVSDEN